MLSHTHPPRGRFMGARAARPALNGRRNVTSPRFESRDVTQRFESRDVTPRFESFEVLINVGGRNAGEGPNLWTGAAHFSPREGGGDQQARHCKTEHDPTPTRREDLG